MDQWTKQYLSILEIEEAKPDYPYLQRLTEAHLHRIPFELCSKFHYFSNRESENLIPSKNEFMNHLLEFGWGGNCYILNIHFGQLLQSLGFDVKIVRARGGNNHLGLMVSIGGKSYYTDVGYMAPLFEPLYLENEPYLVQCGEEIMIKRMDVNRFLIDRKQGGQSFVTKTIEWEPVELDSFQEDIIHSHRDEDENPFMRRFVATIFKERAAYSVVNNRLWIKSNHHIQVNEFHDKKEWMKMINSHYGLRERELEESLQFLENRNVHIFS
ncbi:arylamine N-acetyltransferase [Neobacillus sp. LXY-1]|uniref:arylamine N-acetyltransferase n=1 Tax=Neobacillus sp. LXY-1 TaxID=3379133 RepID=UPI003EE0B40C